MTRFINYYYYNIINIIIIVIIIISTIFFIFFSSKIHNKYVPVVLTSISSSRLEIKNPEFDLRDNY